MSGPAVTLRVLLFARARELAGVSSLSLSVPGEAPSLTQARAAILAALPALAPLLASPSTLLALNASYVESEDTAIVRNGDEVAVIPPVSGG